LKFASSDPVLSTGRRQFAWNDVNRGQLFDRLQSDYPNAGCANENPTAAAAALVVGVLIMIWL